MPSRFHKYLSAGLLAIFSSLLWSTMSQSGAIHVSPIELELTLDQPVSVLKVQNQGDQNELIEIAPYRWTQQTSQFDLTPAPDLIVTPPIFNLQPGQSRLVRVGVMVSELFSGDKETAFRLVIDKTTLDNDQQQIKIKTRISLPVYLPPDMAQGRKPEIALQHRPDNKIVLRAHNPDNRRIRIFEVTLQDATGNRSVTLKKPDTFCQDAGLRKNLKNPVPQNFTRPLSDIPALMAQVFRKKKC